MDSDLREVGVVSEEEVTPEPNSFVDGSVIIEYEVVMLFCEGGKKSEDVTCVALAFTSPVGESEHDSGGGLSPGNDPVSSRFNSFGGDSVPG